MNLCAIAILAIGLFAIWKNRDFCYRMMITEWCGIEELKSDEDWRFLQERRWLQNGFTVEVPLDFDFSVEASLVGHYSFAVIDRILVEHL